jgi:ribose transport system permease protein
MISTVPAGRVTSALSTVALQRLGPVPYSFVVLLAAIAVVAFVLYRTAFGRRLLAVGGDEAAARSTGVPVARVLVTAYVIAGVLAALAGVLLAARATVGSPPRPGRAWSCRRSRSSSSAAPRCWAAGVRW